MISLMFSNAQPDDLMIRKAIVLIISMGSVVISLLIQLQTPHYINTKFRNKGCNENDFILKRPFDKKDIYLVNFASIQLL